MFGEEVGYLATEKKDTSEEYNTMIDKEVNRMLQESAVRVEGLLK